MPRKRGQRVYQKNGRWYGDFRDYKDVGGGQEALIPASATRATDDHDQAIMLANARLAELKALRNGDLKKAADARRKREPTHVKVASRAVPIPQGTPFRVYAERFITQLEANGADVNELAKQAHQLEMACCFFTWVHAQENRAIMQLPEAILTAESSELLDLPEITLEVITKPMVALYREYLSLALVGRGGGKPAASTVRHYLYALSGFFRAAAEAGLIDLNPVQGIKKPQVRHKPAMYLNPPDAALFLEAARLHQPKKRPAIEFAHALVGTLLLTGMRFREVAGVRVADVSLREGTIRVADNEWRSLKNAGSMRTVRIWPQLHEILNEYLKGPHAPRGDLLFPSHPNRRRMRKGRVVEQMMRDPRTVVRAIAQLANMLEFDVRTFRHTYISMRLQTVDEIGKPLSIWEVCKEVGHSSTQMIEKTYGHLLSVKQRKSVVEYRLEDYAAELGERITELRERAAFAGQTQWDEPAVVQAVPLVAQPVPLAMLRRRRQRQV
jgi:integrase